MQSQKYKVFPFSRFCHETTRIRCEAQIVRNSEGQEFAFLICAPCCRRISECRAPAPIGGLTHAVSGDLSVHRGRGSLCAAFCYCSSNGSIEQAMSKCCLIWNVRQSFEAVHHRANSRSIIYKFTSARDGTLHSLETLPSPGHHRHIGPQRSRRL